MFSSACDVLYGSWKLLEYSCFNFSILVECFCVICYISWELAIYFIFFLVLVDLIENIDNPSFSFINSGCLCDVLMLIRGYCSFNGKMDPMSLIRAIISGQRLIGLSIGGANPSQTLLMLALAVTK